MDSITLHHMDENKPARDSFLQNPILEDLLRWDVLGLLSLALCVYLGVILLLATVGIICNGQSDPAESKY